MTMFRYIKAILLGIIITACMFALITLVLAPSGYVGANKWTRPRCPRPGDRVRISLHEASSGWPVDAWRWGSKISVHCDPVLDDFGESHIWWLDVVSDHGKFHTGVPGLVKYQVDPITGQRLSGPYAVVDWDNPARMPSISLTVANDFESVLQNTSREVTLSCTSSRGNFTGHITFKIFPRDSSEVLFAYVSHYLAIAVVVLIAIYSFVRLAYLLDV